MKFYAFELGRHKKLSLAELIAVLDKKNLKEEGLDTAIFELENKNFDQLQDKLGGSIKIIEILDKIPSSKKISLEKIQKKLEPILQKRFKGHSGKIPFSVNFYNFKRPQFRNSKQILNFSKKFLKSLGFNCRFVNKNFKNPPSSTIYKAKVIKKGIDICIIKGKKHDYLGKAITIQNIDNYSKRDYKKPKRDAKVGMTPPKLAQIMINLAGPSKTILDPFCGTGTFLMEGLLMEKDVVGSDNDARMVKYSKENCKWAQQEFNTFYKAQIFEKDARLLLKSDLIQTVDAIVTEGYLGPTMEKTPSEEEIDKNFRSLSDLHLNWLIAAYPLLKKQGKITMCVTAYKTKTGIIHLPRFEDIAELAGFEVRKQFTYYRPDQVVVRDIYVLEKKNK